MSETLEDRLRRLLDEARQAGAQAALAPQLRAFLAELPAATAVRGDGGVTLTHGMVGHSAPMRAVHSLIERVGPSDVPVLIHGETGAGKELVALALHARSGRKGRFLAENCAAVPANLLESELFGHKRGSFTGAVADRDGHFVAADGGTLFLDEIGDMPLEMQAKLLRVLETHEVRPVGGNKVRKVDVRVVAATHRDLAEMVSRRAFREDLFYRLNVVRIVVPPLRERPEDIGELVRFFVAREGTDPARVSPEALEALQHYAWPGNVRQLENEIRRALALGGGAVELAGLSSDVQAAAGAAVSDGSVGGSVGGRPESSG